MYTSYIRRFSKFTANPPCEQSNLCQELRMNVSSWAINSTGRATAVGRQATYSKIPAAENRRSISWPSALLLRVAI
jgi:hypothetical protein